MFTIYPAIDLRGGRCVRLLHGKADHETVYFDDPLEAAKKWIDEGAEWLHIVDLDGAFTGKPAHLSIISKIAEMGVRIQIGGGLRNAQAIARVLEAGAARAVIGTSAVENPEFPEQAVSLFGANAVAVGLDARDGKLALRGWVKGTEVGTIDFVQKMQLAGVKNVIHTDIATDGALTGPNLQRQSELSEACDLSVIASGGVSSLADVIALHELSKSKPNLSGVIVGRAIYEGRVSVGEMIDATRG